MTYIVYTKQQFQAAVNDATDKTTIKLVGPIELAHGETISLPPNIDLIISSNLNEPFFGFTWPEHERVVFYG